jgi:hypothetical protein
MNLRDDRAGRRVPVLAALAPIMLGGCFGSPTPWDRPWVDFGCETPGVCRVRGTLLMSADGGWPHGRLVLDDGRCLWVDLPGKLAKDATAWNGRRVAVRGQSVARAIEGPCAAQGLLLYAERLSLRPDR